MKKKVDDECDLSCETERIKGYIVEQAIVLNLHNNWTFC